MRCSGFGEVYRAIDKTTNQKVAIKKVGRKPYDERRDNEWIALRKCKSPFVVEFYDAFHTGNELWVWFG